MIGWSRMELKKLMRYSPQLDIVAQIDATGWGYLGLRWSEQLHPLPVCIMGSEAAASFAVTRPLKQSWYSREFSTSPCGLLRNYIAAQEMENRNPRNEIVLIIRKKQPAYRKNISGYQPVRWQKRRWFGFKLLRVGKITLRITTGKREKPWRI